MAISFRGSFLRHEPPRNPIQPSPNHTTETKPSHPRKYNRTSHGNQPEPATKWEEKRPKKDIQFRAKQRYRKSTDGSPTTLSAHKNIGFYTVRQHTKTLGFTRFLGGGTIVCIFSVARPARKNIGAKAVFLFT